jgi:hypothetical protein
MACSEQQDGGCNAAMAGFLAHSEPVGKWHHHIEDDEIKLSLVKSVKCPATVIDRRDIVFFELENALDGFAD